MQGGEDLAYINQGLTAFQVDKKHMNAWTEKMVSR